LEDSATSIVLDTMDESIADASHTADENEARSISITSNEPEQDEVSTARGSDSEEVLSLAALLATLRDHLEEHSAINNSYSPDLDDLVVIDHSRRNRRRCPLAQTPLSFIEALRYYGYNLDGAGMGKSLFIKRSRG
jgi:hypothetical protein